MTGPKGNSESCFPKTHKCRFWQIFVEALEEFTNLFIQSETSASTHGYSESNHASKYVLLLGNVGNWSLSYDAATQSSNKLWLLCSLEVNFLLFVIVMISSIVAPIYELQKTTPWWSRDIISVPQMNINKKKRDQLGNRKIYRRRPLSAWTAVKVASLLEPKVSVQFQL